MNLFRFREAQATFTPTKWDWWWNDCFLMRSHLWRATQEQAPALQGDVLDFGCGSKPYRQLFKGGNYIGVDIGVSGHDHTDSQIDILYDGTKLDFPEGRFDAIITTEVLEHLFDYDRVLAELRRVLRPGGRLFLTTPFLWPEHEKPYDYARYTSFGLKALLEKHGFEQVVVQRRGHAIEALSQMALAYAIGVLTPRTPLLRRLFTIFWCSVFNLAAMVGRSVLPSYADIYLSNIATGVKPGGA